MARKTLKLLHTLGAVGLSGALLVHIILLASLPDAASLPEQMMVRSVIARVAQWLLLPSLGIVLAAGLLSLAAHPPFRNAGWVWLKAALGLAVFEGTLVSVQGPAVRNAEYTARALAGELEPARLAALLHSEWGALWLILAVALANIIIGVWRPNLRRRKGRDAASAS